MKNLQISFAAADGDPSVEEDDNEDEDDEGPATDNDELATAFSRAVGDSMMTGKCSETSCKLERPDDSGG